MVSNENDVMAAAAAAAAVAAAADDREGELFEKVRQFSCCTFKFEY